MSSFDQFHRDGTQLILMKEDFWNAADTMKEASDSLSSGVERLATGLQTLERLTQLQIDTISAHINAMDDAKKQWEASWGEFRSSITADLYMDGYAQLEKLVNQMVKEAAERETAARKQAADISTSTIREVRKVQEDIRSEVKSLLERHQHAFDDRLNEIAAALQGLPPLPVRPIEPTAAKLATYYLRSFWVRTLRFASEATPAAIVVSSLALMRIAIDLKQAGLPLQDVISHLLTRPW